MASALISSAAAALLATAATARAADPRGMPAALSEANPLAVYAIMGAALVAGLGLVSMSLNIWNQIKPRPPLRDQFAATSHSHADALSREEHEGTCKGRAAVAAQSMSRVEHTLAALQTGMVEMDQKAEGRAGKLHGRIDDIAKPLNQMIGRFEGHMEWHRQHGGTG